MMFGVVTTNSYYIYKILTTFGLLALCTFAFSVLVAVSCFNIFEKAEKRKYQAFIPVYNLIVLLSIVEIPPYYFFLLLFPVSNIILIIFVLYKLGKIFGVNGKFILGLLFLPILFVPILAYGDYEYKKKSMSKEKINDYLLLEQSKINELNTEVIKEDNIDSVFKTKLMTMEYVSPYKANQINNPQIKKIDDISLININKKDKIDEEKIEIVEL